MKQSIYSLPIYFSVKNEVSNKDDRFLEVEIDVLHDGLNFNQSIFSKEVINKNIETIKNTPILGFIRQLPDGEMDFKGHEYIITKTDKDKLTRKYVGSVFGVIPESCNARWIRKMAEDGQERDYLRVDGLLWTKFSDSIDIMMRDIEKPHSMELFPDNIEGYENEDGHFVFTSFNFDGCCILGSTDDIQPAMIGSDIKIKDYEINFTMNDFVKSIQSELINKYSEFTKIVDETINQDFTEKVDEKSKQGGIESMDKIDFVAKFDNISAIVRQHEMFTDKFNEEHSRFEVVSIRENEVIVVDKMGDYNCFGLSFTENDGEVEIDFENAKKKKICFEDCTEDDVIFENAFDFGKHIADIENVAFAKVEEANAKITEAEGKVSEYETKVSEFEVAKNEIEEKYNQVNAAFEEMKPKYEEYVLAEQTRMEAELDAQKDAEFAKYETILNDDVNFAALKEKKAEMTVKEIEAECAILYVRKNLANANFSKSNNETMTAGIVDNDDKDGFVATKYGFIPVGR